MSSALYQSNRPTTLTLCDIISTLSLCDITTSLSISVLSQPLGVNDITTTLNLSDITTTLGLGVIYSTISMQNIMPLTLIKNCQQLLLHGIKYLYMCNRNGCAITFMRSKRVIAEVTWIIQVTVSLISQAARNVARPSEQDR